MIGAQAILIAFNILNAFFDAYLIKRALGKNIPKAIRHGVNLSLYIISVGFIIFFVRPSLVNGILFCVSAFCNRQIFFDIPLNWRRGLSWDYVSLDKPPKALMDRIEIGIFGYDGKTPTQIYACLWVLTMLIINFIKSF